jgi:VWFA-related protein
LLLALASLLNAQTPAKPDSTVIHVDAREVDVDVTVTDAKGVPVAGLTKEDFSITDDGKPRAIDSISIAHEYPLISGLPSGTLHLPTRPGVDSAGQTPAVGHSTAIILDEVNTFFESAAEARENVAKLMKKVPADERIALYIISRNQGLLLVQDYTTDHAALLKALNSYIPVGLMPGPIGEQVIPPGLPPLIPAMPPPTEEEKAFKWRENSNAARLSFQKLAEQLAAIPGRKSVFWVTNAFNPWILHLGKEPNSDSLRALDMQKPAWDKTLTQLNEANVAINAWEPSRS